MMIITGTELGVRVKPVLGWHVYHVSNVSPRIQSELFSPGDLEVQQVMARG